MRKYWNHLDNSCGPQAVAVSKPLLTEFGISLRLESCDLRKKEKIEDLSMLPLLGLRNFLLLAIGSRVLPMSLAHRFVKSQRRWDIERTATQGSSLSKRNYEKKSLSFQTRKAIQFKFTYNLSPVTSSVLSPFSLGGHI